MRVKAIARRALIVAFVLGVLCFAARGIGVEVYKARLYTAGQAAAADGQWSEAFVRFSALAGLDADYGDVDVRLAEAARQAIGTVPGGSDLAAEVALLRWLAAAGDEATLAAVLDRCVVAIPAGEFLMGNDAGPADERPQRLVYLDTFETDRYEVTNVQYQRFLQATGRVAPPYWPEGYYPPGQAAVPVVGVTWEDADAYCAWADRSLPTEAEWEKACRGSEGRTYPWGDEWEPERANVDRLDGGFLRPGGYTEPGAVGRGDDWAPVRVTPAGRGSPGLWPVGSYPDGASLYGVADLVGNAAEWVADWYNWSGYWDMPARNPIGLGPEWNRALRGSSWYPYGSAGWAQAQSRCSARNSSHHALPDARVGFRCVRKME